jgi:general secretion pathway protein C
MNGRHQNWLTWLDLALVAVLAAALAHWTWVFSAPAAVAASTYVTPAGEDAVRLRGLFGVPGAAPGALRLVGVVSPERAVFALQGDKARAVRAGEAIVPGTLLREVHRDHVIVERDGARQRLGLGGR